METLVILNPASGAGRTGREWPSLEPTFRKHLGDFQVHCTVRAGEATDVARAALAAGTQRIVSVGGDGTNHEIVNGFFDPATRAPVRPGAIFAFVPRGTGSDFGRTFEVVADLEAHLARIAASPGRPIDLIGCSFAKESGSGWAVCVNIASAGQGGDLVERVNKGFKGIRGGFPFVLYGVIGVFQVQPWAVELCIDGGPPERHDVRNLTICNGQYQGGGMRQAPQARVDDGQLELIVMTGVGPLRAIRIGLTSFSGKMQEQQGVWHRPVRRVEVTPLPNQAPMLVEADGELPGRCPAVFEVLPAALTVAI